MPNNVEFGMNYDQSQKKVSRSARNFFAFFVRASKFFSIWSNVCYLLLLAFWTFFPVCLSLSRKVPQDQSNCVYGL